MYIRINFLHIYIYLNIGQTLETIACHFILCKVGNKIGIHKINNNK